MSAPSIEERRDCPHGYQLGKCDVCDRMECERELAAMTTAKEAAERKRDEEKARRERSNAARDDLRGTILDLRAELAAAREEIERLTKLNDLLMDDKHDWEKGQRRLELLEMVGMCMSGMLARGDQGKLYTDIVTGAMKLIDAVDAALKEQQP